MRMRLRLLEGVSRKERPHGARDRQRQAKLHGNYDAQRQAVTNIPVRRSRAVAAAAGEPNMRAAATSMAGAKTDELPRWGWRRNILQ